MNALTLEELIDAIDCTGDAIASITDQLRQSLTEMGTLPEGKVVRRKLLRCAMARQASMQARLRQTMHDLRTELATRFTA